MEKDIFFNGKYLVIYPSGVCQWVAIDRKDLIPKLHELIGCSSLDYVHSMLSGVTFWVDDLGKMYDQPLPINVLASKLYAGTQHGDPIVGTVVIGSELVDPESEYGERDFFPLTKVGAYVLCRRLCIQLEEVPGHV